MAYTSALKMADYIPPEGFRPLAVGDRIPLSKARGFSHDTFQVNPLTRQSTKVIQSAVVTAIDPDGTVHLNLDMTSPTNV